MKKIAVVLPVYNHLEHTRNCIKTLDELIHSGPFSHSEYHLVVIDDGSTDGTKHWILANYKWVTILLGNGSLWWSGGVNKGARYAIDEMGVDYLLLWNNDITPAKDYFIQLDKLIPEAEERSLIGSKIYYHDHENLIWSFGGIFNPENGKKYMIGMDQIDSERFQQPLRVDWLPGMGTLIPVQVVEKIGYWDDAVFPQYHGDSDFTIRAGRHGYLVMVYPQLRIWNDKTTSGLTHGDTIVGLFDAMTNIRSNLNIRKNLIFYHRYSTSWKAYGFLIRYYWKVIGGFMKWKVFSVFGKKRD